MALLHRVRDQLMRQRTATINALRAHLAEFGIAAAQRRAGVRELLAVLGDLELMHGARARGRTDRLGAWIDGAPAVQRRGRGGGQQAGAHHLGDAVPRRGLPGRLTR